MIIKSESRKYYSSILISLPTIHITISLFYFFEKKTFYYFLKYNTRCNFFYNLIFKLLKCV